ncbi:hypothetical protein [Legionella worsleiensis]|uniref:Uncharacterized protein n=1 Tax=Legionella worsleiensis TaxID=45076 RepID=A0A0W1AE98_9GAMM|nr:hypothetical protein [Legionella worsleiensis]KTD79650.1 hypothetical protein Lwor_1164 [Legionella worsleiensis]STY32160.1 Uncharacterised protein [Legionella worsleiensis]
MPFDPAFFNKCISENHDRAPGYSLECQGADFFAALSRFFMYYIASAAVCIVLYYAVKGINAEDAATPHNHKSLPDALETEDEVSSSMSLD